MNSIEISLEKIGLSQKETQVYLCLLKFGESLPANISKITGISRSTVYQILDKLVEKELIIKIVHNNVYYFKHLNLDNLLMKIHEEENNLIIKKNILHDILPKLKELSSGAGNTKKSKISTAFGIEGYKNILSSIKLDKNINKMFMISSTDSKNKNKYLIDFEREILLENRKKKGIKMYLITDKSDVSDIIQSRDLEDLRETKILDGHINLETFMIYGDYFLICRDDGDIHTTLIKDHLVSSTISWMFDFIWDKN